MEEIWKDIDGYNGDYQISNYGRVISNKYNKIKYLKMYISRNGYVSVILCLSCKVKKMYVHTIVWDHFGDTSRLLQVDHIDNNKLNNRIDNLQLLSCRNNITKYHLTTKKTSKYTGVWWYKKCNLWASRIYINSTFKYLGYFKTEEEAHLAYQNAKNNSK